MNDLKPCPFCGSKNVTIIEGVTNFFEKINYVLCRSCQCRGASSRFEERAVEVWNRRVNDE